MEFDDDDNEPTPINTNFGPSSVPIPQSPNAEPPLVRVFQNVQVSYSTEFPVIPATLKNNQGFNWRQIVESQVTSNHQKKLIKEVPRKDLTSFALSLCPDVENLVGLMAHQTNSLKVKEMEGFFLGKVNHDLLFRRFKCRNCGDFLVQINLKCRHSTCFSCFIRNVRSLIEKPSIQTANKCRCKKCYEFHSIEDVRIYFNGSNNEIQEFETLQVFKTCLWCKRKLNIFQEFWAELECFHLCKTCYSHELFMNVKSCMVCKSYFKNKEVSYRRETSCRLCPKKGKIIKEGFWAFHEDHYLCFECHGKITKFVNCPICEQNISQGCITLFKNFINKKCAVCKEVKNIADIKICSECSNFSCEHCLDFKECIKCG